MWFSDITSNDMLEGTKKFIKESFQISKQEKFNLERIEPVHINFEREIFI